MTDFAKSKNRLEAQLLELQARVSRIRDGLTRSLDKDSSERAIELEELDTLESQALLIEEEIASVERALERIAQGTYGICVRCGGTIARARREARPEAALCIDCANAP